MTEERVEKLTPPASLAGAALGAEGSIFAWFNDRPDGLWITTDGRRYFIAPPALRGPVGAIFLAGERVAEVVDTATSDIRRVNISGEVTSSRPLRAGMPVLTAVYTDSCWYIGGAPSASRFVVARVQPSGDAVSIADFSAAPRDSGAPAVVGGMLAPLGRGVLVALRAAPHTTVVLDSLGRSLVKVSDTLFSALVAEAPDIGVKRFWVTSSVASTDDGWVQVLSDLRTTTRLIVTFDQSGQVIRHRFIDAPFGVIASRPAKRVLLAARQIDTPELVLYRWRWRAITP